MKKKKNCSNVKGYSCGRTCIKRTYVCKVDGLTGQSIQIASKLTSTIETVSKPETKTKTNNKPIHKPLTFEEQIDEHFSIGHKPEDYKSYGIKNPKETSYVLTKYTGLFSTDIKKAEAGVLGEEGEWLKKPKALKMAKVINNFIDKAPSYKGEIYSGFSHDMVDVYGSNKLKVGSEFSFPSITSFSSSEAVAKGFNGGGKFKIVNNATGSSVMGVSSFDKEMEVLVPKKAKYKVIDIDNSGVAPLFILEEQ